MAEHHETGRHPDILDDVPMKADGEAPGWFDNPANVKRIIWAVYLMAGALLVMDPLIHRHGYFAIEQLWGSYGVFSFISCVFLVVAGAALRSFVMRPEDYYSPKDGADG